MRTACNFFTFHFELGERRRNRDRKAKEFLQLTLLVLFLKSRSHFNSSLCTASCYSATWQSNEWVDVEKQAKKLFYTNAKCCCHRKTAVPPISQDEKGAWCASDWGHSQIRLKLHTNCCTGAPGPCHNRVYKCNIWFQTTGHGQPVENLLAFQPAG